jgi:hypothetical protein
VLWHFIDGLEAVDLEENESLGRKLEYMVAQIQNPAMQLKMSRELKKLMVCEKRTKQRE